MDANNLRQRFGRFSIREEMLIACPDQVLALLKDMIIVRAEFMFDTRSIEYVGMHATFDVVPEGVMAPAYIAIITLTPDFTYKVEWQRGAA